MDKIKRCKACGGRIVYRVWQTRSKDYFVYENGDIGKRCKLKTDPDSDDIIQIVCEKCNKEVPSCSE